MFVLSFVHRKITKKMKITCIYWEDNLLLFLKSRIFAMYK